MIYFSRNIAMKARTYSINTDQQHLRVKFLGDKKGPMKGFYLEVWKINCLYICEVFIYMHRT